MALNPLSPIDNARATAFRPQLKIAARSIPDVRVRKDDTPRNDYQWRRTLDTVKESVAGAIDKFVTNAAAEADAAGEQAHAQATIEKVELLAEITRRQSLIDDLQADLLAERNALKCMRNQLATEVAARLRSESERDTALQQLDAALTGRSKVIPPVQPVERLSSVETVSQLERASEPEIVSEPEIEDVALVADQITLGEAHPEIVEDIKQVLEQVKEIYDLDLSSDRSSADLIDSLTIRLRQARNVIVGRSSISEQDAVALFNQQVDAMLDTAVGTFGRHLSISAYAATVQ